MVAEARYNITAKDKTKAALKSARAGVNKLGKNLAKVGVVGGVALGLIVKSSLAAGDELAKTADKLGLTTEALSGLRHAASLTGVQQKAFDKGLQNMVRTLRDANNGLMTYKRSYSELGVDTKKLEALSPDKQFMEIAEALSNVEDNTRRVGIAYDLFGAKGTGLLNTLALGKEGLAALSEEARALGISLTRVDTAKMEAANDAIFRAQQSLKGVANTITVELAPFLTVIADKFTAMAVESNGFKDEILGAIESILVGFAKVGDFIQGIKVAIKGLELAFSAVAAVILKVVQVTSIPFVALGELIPGVGDDIKMFGEVLDSAMSEAIKRTSRLKDELDAIATQGLPSEGIVESLEAIKTQANKVAEAVAAARAGKTGGNDAGDTDTASAEQKAALELKLEKIRDSLMTEREIINEDYAIKLEDLAAAEDLKIETLVGYDELREQLKAQHLGKIAALDSRHLSRQEKLWKMGLKGRLTLTSGMLGQLSSLMDTSNKKQFEIGKKAAIAQAIINTYKSAQSGFAADPFFPVGIAMGALALVTGALNVQKIKSQSFSSGAAPSGGAPSTPSVSGGTLGSGGGGATPTLPDNQAITPAPTQQVNITLQGAGYSKEDVRELIGQINEETSDGVELQAGFA